MAYAPTTVTASTPVPSQTLRDNDDALRVYLHEGIIAGDLKASDWIDTRHIQPPTQLVKRGLQTGVTGIAGGQSVRPFERFTFTGYATTGANRRSNQDLWDVVPDTALTIPLAASAKVIYHWHVAAVVGPDTTNPSGAATPVVLNADRRVYLAPYMMKFDEELTGSKVDKTALVEIRQNTSDFHSTVTNRGGAKSPYHWFGYGQRSGIMIDSFTATAGSENIIHVGLAHWSLVQRSMLLNWTVSVEVYYD